MDFDEENDDESNEAVIEFSDPRDSHLGLFADLLENQEI